MVAGYWLGQVLSWRGRGGFRGGGGVSVGAGGKEVAVGSSGVYVGSSAIRVAVAGTDVAVGSTVPQRRSEVIQAEPTPALYDEQPYSLPPRGHLPS